MKRSCCDTHTHYVAGCDNCRRRARHYEQTRQLERMRGQGTRLVDATGTRRRMQALHRIGWDWQTLGGMLGRSTANTQKLAGARKLVRRTTAEKVTRLYDELSMRMGPNDRARRRGERRGWPPPLAWDDETIDNPAATAHGVAKPAPPSTIPRVDTEAVAALDAEGLPAVVIAQKLGVTERTVTRARARLRAQEGEAA